MGHWAAYLVETSKLTNHYLVAIARATNLISFSSPFYMSFALERAPGKSTAHSSVLEAHRKIKLRRIQSMNHSPVCSRAKNQVTGSAISIHVSQTNQRKSLKLHSYNSSIHQLLSKPKTKPQKSLSSLSHAIYLYHGLLTSYSSMN